MKIVDLAGHTYGHFTIIGRAPNRGRCVMWSCVCCCGTTREVAAGNLRSGHTTSCGCKGKGTDRARFLAMVDRASSSSGCWLWKGGTTAGYGSFSLGQINMPAHRAAMRLFREMELPRGHQVHVDHLRRNKLCVNPVHLELVMAAENIKRRDIARFGSQYKTHCKRGHPLEGDNLYISPQGRRVCRQCNAIAAKTFIANKKGLLTCA